MKRIAIIAIATMFVFCLTAVAWASPMSEGKDFMKAGMYREAAGKFDMVIRGDSARGLRADPTNAEAHYLLGECYLKQGMSGQADERFSSALKIDRSYGPKTAALYEATGWSLFGSKPSGANEMFQMAMKYDPGKRASIAEKLFEMGKSQNSEEYFANASQYNPNLNAPIGDFYWGMVSKVANEEQGWGYKVLAAKYNKAKYGATVAKEAEQKAKTYMGRLIWDGSTTYMGRRLIDDLYGTVLFIIVILVFQLLSPFKSLGFITASTIK